MRPPTLPEIVRVAAEAWRMMSRDDDRMPVGIAVDFVQNYCDDRAACKRMIYATAADDLEQSRPDANWPVMSERVVWAILQQKFDTARDAVEEIQRFYVRQRTRFSAARRAEIVAWHKWCGRAREVVTFCYQIEIC